MNALVSTEAHNAFTRLATELDVSVTNILDVIGRRIAAGQPVVIDGQFVTEVQAERRAKRHAPRPRAPRS